MRLAILILMFFSAVPEVLGADEGFVFDEKLNRYFFRGSGNVGLREKFVKMKGRVEVSVDGSPFRPYRDTLNLEKEGRHVVRIRVKDPTGPVVQQEELELYVDRTPPRTVVYTAEKTKIVGNIYCTNRPDGISLKAEDGMSRVARIEYSWDGKKFLPYDPGSPPFDPNRKILYFRSVDIVGNVEPAKSIQYAFSNRPPSTLVRVTPPSYDGPSYRFVGVGHKIALQTKPDIIPVEKTRISLDGTDFIYRHEFSFREPGSHELRYSSVDYGGNEEEEKRVRFFYDAEPPELEVSEIGEMTEVGGFKMAGKEFRLKVEADDEGSGVKKIEYQFNGEGYQTYTEPFRLPRTGRQIVSIRAEDNVGNHTKVLSLTYLGDVLAPKTTLTLVNPVKEIEGALYTAFPNLMTLEAQDNLSGVSKILFDVNDEGFEEYQGAVPLDEVRQYKIVFKAIDRVGNEEATHILLLNPASSLSTQPREVTGNDSTP